MSELKILACPIIFLNLKAKKEEETMSEQEYYVPEGTYWPIIGSIGVILSNVTGGIELTRYHFH